MQKFGLQRKSSFPNSAIELELAKEQASALGRTGKKLRLSLERYQMNQGHDSNLEISNTLQASDIREISNNLWELMLQRELLGFCDNNLSWILENYVVPQAAIDCIGRHNR
ncbi:MAG: hypothetical protein ACJAQ6_000277 [Arenicella sp.]|jgi:hypothetical protein